MARRDRRPEGEPDRSAAEYYKLNTRAVEDLVTADESNSPPVSPQELRKYKSMPRVHLGDGIKALLIKAWFAGAVCFFFLWGLGAYIGDHLDQMVVLGIALGTVTDLLTNNVFRFYAPTPGANDRWMMFPRRKWYSLFFNIPYAFLLLACVTVTYNGINTFLVAVGGLRDTVPLGVGPILFGVFTVAWDELFLLCKRTLARILRDARQSAGR